MQTVGGATVAESYYDAEEGNLVVLCRLPASAHHVRLSHHPAKSQPTALPNRDDDMSEEEKEKGKLKHQESRIFRKIVVEGRECLLTRPSLIH